MSIRPFDRDRDLAGVLDFVGRSRARGDSGAIFHPGGLQWWLRRVGRDEFDVGVLLADARPVGLALRDGTDVIVQADAAHANSRRELLAWVEAAARPGGSDLLVSVADGDDHLAPPKPRDRREIRARLGVERESRG